MPVKPLLGRDDIHVWRADLDADADTLTTLETTLADDERETAARFHFPRDRRRFITGRGMLRAILACYLDTTPTAVRFRRKPGHKPELGGLADGGLRFNAAHSDAMALYAVAWRREVGIDVERIRPELTWAPLAARFFSPPERAAIAGAGHQAVTMFTRIWVAKEAYLKGMGVGLAHRLDTFVVPPVTGMQVRLGLAGDSEDDRTWLIADLDVGPGYAAAVAAEGWGWRVTLADWHREPAGVRRAG